MPNPREVVYAPYNFVPLAPAVYLPAWAGKASQDRPFADGISGTIPLTISARSPLLVGGRRKREEGKPIEVEFVAAPDRAGTPFIPGSSLRGLIRAVIEIAAFGRMRYVDDRRFAFRDLSAGMSKAYRKRMTDDEKSLPKEQGGAAVSYKPLVSAGWLRFDPPGKWTITPCEFARIERGLVLGTLNEPAPYTAAVKYGHIGFPARPLERRFEIGPELAHQHSANKPLGYRKAILARPGSGTARPGMLVFTGQPNNPARPRSKHMEFVFYDPNPARQLTVTEAVMSDFLAINTADQQRADTWSFWKKPEHMNAAGGIPVFYLTDAGGAVESLGLSMMYKLPYRASVHDLLRRHGGRAGQDGPHLAETGRDLADTLFGEVRDGADSDQKIAALKGRVSFGHAKVAGPARATRQPAAILSTPKASYLPSYIVQPQADAAGKLPQVRETQYRSYEDDGRGGQPPAELRGWKRYPVRRDARTQQIPPTLTEQNAIQSVLHTLPAETRFEGEMRLHNVRPAELGALLFALRLSETFEAGGPERWHALGLGKPFGFGAVVIETGVTAEAWGKEAGLVSNDPGRPLPSPKECLDAFKAEMDAFCTSAGLGAWAASPQIKALFAMAEPDQVKSGSLLMEQVRDAVNTIGGAMGEAVREVTNLEQNVGYGPAHPLASMPLQDFAKRKSELRALPEFSGEVRSRANPVARPPAAPRPGASRAPAPATRPGFRFLRGDKAIIDDELCTVMEDVSDQDHARNRDIRISVEGNDEVAAARSLRPLRR